LDALKKSIDFKKVYQGRKFYTKAFVVHYIKTNSATQPVFGFTVSKKAVSKKAVDRNLVRRRMRSCVREHLDPNVFLGYAFVLTAIKSTQQATWRDYVNSARMLQKKINL